MGKQGNGHLSLREHSHMHENMLCNFYADIILFLDFMYNQTGQTNHQTSTKNICYGPINSPNVLRVSLIK